MEIRRNAPFPRGMTVLELLLAIAVAAVAAAAGIPAMQNLIAGAQRQASVSALVAAVQFARSTSLTRNATVVLCQTSDGARCATSPQPGRRWIVTAGTTAQGITPPSAGTALRVVNLSFQGEVFSNRDRFEFRPYPLRSTNGTISLCDRGGARTQRAVIISHTGRPRVAAPATAAGFARCAQ